jgi:hydrogenase maturation protease
MKKILLYGYGNPGRQDDALGAEFVEIMEKWTEEQGLNNIEFDCNYQLNIEDADNIAEKDIVIFADASLEPIEDYLFTKITPSPEVSFTMHAVSPAFVVDLCKKINGKIPASYLLHIKGYEWELEEGLTDKAKQNLNNAVKFIQEKIQNIEPLIIDFHKNIL